jgi:hypothetical protein
LIVVMVYNLLHHIVSFVVGKLGNHGDFLIGLCFTGDVINYQDELLPYVPVL